MATNNMEYISLRGVKSTTRPIRFISMRERENIMFDYVKYGSVFVKHTYNINNAVLGHIKFHHRNFYHRAVRIVSAKIREYQHQGMTSLQIGERLGMQFHLVNRFY